MKQVAQFYEKVLEKCPDRKQPIGYLLYSFICLLFIILAKRETDVCLAVE